MMEALSVEKYFAEMDRKKAQLMNRLDNGWYFSFKIIKSYVSTAYLAYVYLVL